MKQVLHQTEKTKIILFIFLIACCAISFVKPIAQDQLYHLFADCRTISNIPNAWNVLSNVPFLIIGFLGIYSVSRSHFEGSKLNHLVFFIGIFLTGLGSSFYHHNPNNNTLVWDRLPMTISFMSFFAIIMKEYLGTKRNVVILILLLAIGITSVIYWHFTELKGCGDLRLYILVQFLPIILIPLIMLIGRSQNIKPVYLWLMLVAYGISKATETFDDEVFKSLKFVSGHSIKHLFAALAPLFFLIGIHRFRN